MYHAGIGDPCPIDHEALELRQISQGREGVVGDVATHAVGAKRIFAHILCAHEEQNQNR